MPDYGEIIQTLTKNQKLRLLVDFRVLSEPEYRAVGIPAISFADADNSESAARLSPGSLADTWDVGLMQEIACRQAENSRKNGTVLTAIPAPKARIGLLSEGISEDPWLSRTVAQAYRTAYADLSLPFVTGGLCLNAQDAAWMGSKPDRRTVEEALLHPLYEMRDGRACSLGVLLQPNHTIPAYREMNLSLAENLPEGQFVFCYCHAPEDTVRYLQKGYVLIGGNLSALTAAMQKDTAVRNDIAGGKDTHAHLEQLTAAGEAISDDTVNSALIRILDAAFRMDRMYHPPTETSTEISDGTKHVPADATPAETAPADTAVETAAESETDLAYRAAIGSTVLLRNRNILPLKPVSADKWHKAGRKKSGRKTKKSVPDPSRILMIGDPMPESGEQPTGYTLFSERMKANGIPITDFAPGYDPSAPDGGHERISEALDLCADAYRILLFLRTSPHATSRTLPANQLMLAHAMKHFGYKTVVIVCGEKPFDTGFASEYAGLIRVPPASPRGMEALADILCGKVDPGGRLAVTLYSDTQRMMAERRRDCERYDLRTGPFFGYRVYPDLGLPTDQIPDTRRSMEYTPGFSFGHGLSYARISYSNLQIKEAEVSFRVTNLSKHTGTVVPQVYIGIRHSSVLRPHMQLCGATHLVLHPKESRIVSIPLRLPQVSDSATGEYVTEGGRYTVSVGASATDLRLSKTTKITGASVAPDGEPQYKYWVSESNIVQDGYTLEANYKMKKRNPRNICLGLILLGLAAGVRYFSFDSGVQSPFINITSVILLLCAIACFVFEFIDRNRDRNRMIDEVKELNDRFFETAEKVEAENAADLFVKESEEEAYPSDDMNDLTAETAADTDDEYHYLDRAFTFPDAVADFTRYAKMCGYRVEEDTVRSLFAALSSSHLLIADQMTTEQISTLHELLCGYFGTFCGSVTVGESTKSEIDLLITRTESGTGYSDLYRAIENAGKNCQTPVLFRLSGVSLKGMPDYLAPFVRFSASPFTMNTLHIPGIDGHEKEVVLPQNFWLLIDPEEANADNRLENMSAFLTEVSALISCQISPCEAVETEHIKHLSFWQFKYLYEKARDELAISEDYWKKIDWINKKAEDYATFHMSNRLSLGIEQYAATFLACGGETETAIDYAMTARLIPSVIVATAAMQTAEDGTLDNTWIVSKFGEDAFPLSYQMAKRGRDSGFDSASPQTVPVGKAEEDGEEEMTPDVEATEDKQTET